MKQTVYIASPESQQIHVWNLNHEGALTLTQVVDVPGQVQPAEPGPDTEQAVEQAVGNSDTE